MRENVGICRGGPWAGRRIAERRPWVNVPIMPKASVFDPNITPVSIVKVGTYTYQGHGVWQWSEEDGTDRRAGTPAHSNPAGKPGNGAGAREDSWFTLPEPEAPRIPYAGIRAGEVIGERMWWVHHEGLCSFTHKCIWRPGEVMTGDVDKVVWRSDVEVLYGGVYSYFPGTADYEWIKAKESMTCVNAVTHSSFFYRHPIERAIGAVRGKVACWGEVVEHECGWRAENAKIIEINEVFTLDRHEEIVPEIIRPYMEAL